MKKIIKITFLFLFVILSCGCGKVNVSVDSKSLFYMDTYIQLKLYDCANSEEIFNKIDNIYKEYHMSSALSYCLLLITYCNFRRRGLHPARKAFYVYRNITE